MLQLGSFLLQLVVVILQYFDQAFEVRDLVFVVKLDLVKLDPVILRNVGHLPQSSVFSQHILHLPAQRVNFRNQFGGLFGFDVLLLPQLINPAHRVLRVRIPGIVSQVFA